VQQRLHSNLRDIGTRNGSSPEVCIVRSDNQLAQAAGLIEQTAGSDDGVLERRVDFPLGQPGVSAP